ncbi:MAG: hypothetical protein RLO52_22755 [Sandaracinaceae bacterium]
MPPAWARRLMFFTLLGVQAVVFVAIGHPEACADVWTLEHHERACCHLSSETRFTQPGGDCCDYGWVDARDPLAGSTALSVAPAPFVRLATMVSVPPAPVRVVATPIHTIPERPPDRALRATVLLI